jgi:hypothetical protein
MQAINPKESRSSEYQLKLTACLKAAQSVAAAATATFSLR